MNNSMTRQLVRPDLRDKIIQYMHRKARKVTIGEIALYCASSLNYIIEQMNDLAHAGKIMAVNSEDTDYYILTERPSVRVAGDKLDVS